MVGMQVMWERDGELHARWSLYVVDVDGSWASVSGAHAGFDVYDLGWVVQR